MQSTSISFVFVVLCFHVWFAPAFCLHYDPTWQYHHIGNILANNTSMLSWMIHVGQVHMPPSHQLTYFLQVFQEVSHQCISLFITHLGINSPLPSTSSPTVGDQSDHGMVQPWTTIGQSQIDCPIG